MFRFKKHFSKTKKIEFAQKMDEIWDFCVANDITFSKKQDSYYFTLNNKKYRISNHTIAASNNAAFNEYGTQIRDFYHNDNENIDVYIIASKTRLIEIYENLKAGKKFDKRGRLLIKIKVEGE
ncbi:hypothetical protein [Metamycoplasma buccale]|uniref:hypothetical protein n=1 Tax=Metamycoplasma buccale TaxID=55602 RepID=UPI00398F25B7